MNAPGFSVRNALPIPTALPDEFQDRFWARVSVGNQDDCWTWKGGLSRGYGTIRFRGRIYRASRIALALRGVPPLPSQVVRHTCDNPSCVNPYHLIAGSHAENMRDMRERGRSTRGSRNPRAKLTSRDIETIKSSPESTRALARSLGVSQTCIMDVRLGRRWAA